MVIKDKDNTAAGGVDPEVVDPEAVDPAAVDPGTVVPAPITPVKGKGTVAPDGEEEKDDTQRAPVPIPGGVEVTINGTGGTQQEKSVGDSAEAQAARILHFQ